MSNKLYFNDEKYIGLTKYHNMILPVEIKLLHPNFVSNTWELPKYATNGSAAVDLLAAIDAPITIIPKTTEFIPSGIAVHIKDQNYALALIPRSSAGCNLNISLGNTVGLIDSDYQGEIKMCVYNKTDTELVINPAQKICQMIAILKGQMIFEVVNEFSENTDRGTGGFGSTGD